MSINTTSDINLSSNIEEDNFKINLNLIDTKEVLITNKNPKPN